MPVRLTSQPATEPVTLAEAKAHLRLDDALDDSDVTRLIRAAREYVEQVCWRGLITQTYEAVLDGFRGEDTLELGSRGGGGMGQLEHLELPFGQLQSVTSVQYVDANGVQQTLAASEYSVDTVSVPGRLRPAYGKAWPSTRSQWDAVRITYVVGWANAEAVPAPIKQALLLCLAEMYEKRTPAPTGSSTVDALLSAYRLVRF